jgi:N-dimethylarginine dimethylaminohydrolase
VFPVSRALRKRGAEIIQPQIGTHYSLEGGDVVFAPGRRIFLGHGFRSTENASRVLSMAFPYHRVIPIRLLDPYFYHLDTCFCPLPDGKHAVIYEHAFDETSSALLCNEFEKIQTTREEALLFTCNAVCVLHRGVVHYVCHPTTKRMRDRLASLNIVVVEVDVSEFHKAGGSVRCLLLDMNN